MNREAWDAKQNRKLETVQRNKDARAKRTPEEQLKVLDERLGKGQGAKKERERLLAQIKQEE